MKGRIAYRAVIIPVKAREYVLPALVCLSVCVSVCDHDN